MVKSLRKLEKKESVLDLIKVIYEKIPIDDIILNGKYS